MHIIRMNTITKEIETHWSAISPLFSIHNEREYQEAVERVEILIDEIGTNEQHPLYELLDTLGTLIHAYEEKHYPMPECSGAEMLSFFMEEHGLTQSELPEIGTQRVISDILNGKQELNIKQIRTLSKRFHVSPALFI